MPNNAENSALVTISKYFVRAVMEMDADGNAPSGYWALTADGRGEPVAVIAGVEIVTTRAHGEGVYEWGLIDGYRYALRDVLSFARRGLNGLSIVTDHEPARALAHPKMPKPTEPMHKGDLNQF